MTAVILFTLGSQSLLERSPKTADVSLIAKKLNIVVAIYYAEEKKYVWMWMWHNKEERDQSEKASEKIRKRAYLKAGLFDS